jgi:hypothetical protein
MQQELGNSILADYKRMYYDAKSIKLLVKDLPDEQVWSYISRENAGLLGFCRRFLFHLKHHE